MQLFSEDEIGCIFDYLKLASDKGKPFDYRITIDGKEVVARTNDLDFFAFYERRLQNDPKYMTIFIYTAQKVHSKHEFCFSEDDLDNFNNQPRQQGLSGMEIDARIQAERQKWNEEMAMKEMKKEIEWLKEELAEKDSEYEELEKEKEAVEEELQKLKESISPLHKVFGDFAGPALEYLIKNNIEGTKKAVPVLGMPLAGIFSEQQQLPVSAEREPEVHVQLASAHGREDKPVENEQIMNYFIQQFRAILSEEEYDQLLFLLEQLRQKPAQIPVILDLIKENNKESENKGFNIQDDEIHI